jgi:cyclophilin family peptidyl-prolyl cis-trans isomerase
MEAIIAALGYIGDPRAVPLLEQELTNDFPSIRAKAHKALKMITGKDYPVEKRPPRLVTRIDFPPVAAEERPLVKFHTTRGDFVLELRPDKAPVTVANFLYLVKKQFYHNIYFHRVIPGFVVQAGDPRGDGWGGPGYTIPCEYNDLFFDRGVVGMATAGKDTGGSQFFITQLPQPHLNGRYTAFGKVVSGMNVIDHLEPYDRILDAEIISNR